MSRTEGADVRGQSQQRVEARHIAFTVGLLMARHRRAASVAAVAAATRSSIGIIRLASGTSALALSCLLASCGTAELDVEPAFDDTWDVTSVVVDGVSVDVGGAVVIEIDTGQSAVRGVTPCQRFFGSYSLDDGADEGEASFTIPSPEASEDCAAADRDLHEGVVTALENVSQWQRTGSTLVLTSSTDTELVLESSSS